MVPIKIGIHLIHGQGWLDIVNYAGLTGLKYVLASDPGLTAWAITYRPDGPV